MLSVVAMLVLFMGAERDEAHAAACRSGDVLGVSRTVTLNTSGGKRFGASHGGDVSFLRDKEVVLTFDDGPIPQTTNKVLLELERQCVRATFFMVGRMARNHPAMVRKVLSKGHTVGIHSYSHRDLKRTNPKSAVQDVDLSIRTINEAAGRNVSRFFRFPYLSESAPVNAYLSQRGYGIFAVDVDSLDYRFSKPNSMVNRVMSELRRKGRGIILLHDIQKVTASGIGLLLKRLKREGYKVVHIRGTGHGTPDPLVLASYDEPAKSKPETALTYSDSGDLSITFKDRKNVSKAKPKAVQPERQPSRKVSTSKVTRKTKPKRRKQVRTVKVAKKPAARQSTKNAAQKKTRKVAYLSRRDRIRKQQEAFRKRMEARREIFRQAMKKRRVNQ